MNNHNYRQGHSGFYRGNDNGGIPGVSSRGRRDQRRAFDYNRKNSTNWYEQSRDFEEREYIPKPTRRSAAWKAKKQQANQEVKPLSKDYSTKGDDIKETPSKDSIEEVNYEVAQLSPAMPITACYAQNFDMSGLPILIEQTYLNFLKINPRLGKEMPLSVYQHYITTKINAVLIDRVKESKQNDIFTGQWAKDLFPEDTMIPGPIFDYISYIAEEIMTTGSRITINIPDIATPHGPVYNQDDEMVAPSGSFGYVDQYTHNAYECYISPLVTSRMVLNELREHGQQPMPPLPPDLVPVGAVPTLDLLGYREFTMCSPEARQRYAGIRFPNDDSLVGVLRLEPQIEIQVNNCLKALSERYTMKDFSLCKQKNFLSNSCFIEAEATGNEPLRNSMPAVFSRETFSSIIANVSLMFGHHVRRTETSPGNCYLLPDGEFLDGWVQTRNDNFAMRNHFRPVKFRDLPEIRHEHFRVSAADGYRSVTVQDLSSRFERKRERR